MSKLLKLISDGNMGSDCTAPYIVKFNKENITVFDFIKYVCETFSNEWGIIDIKYKDSKLSSLKYLAPSETYSICRIEYKYGKIITEHISQSILDKKIDINKQSRASGGWSRMDYRIYTVDDTPINLYI